jgi:hypothetical protein
MWDVEPAGGAWWQRAGRALAGPAGVALAAGEGRGWGCGGGGGGGKVWVGGRMKRGLQNGGNRGRSNCRLLFLHHEHTASIAA